MKKPSTRYVNRNGQGQRETVDAFPYSTREEQKEARQMVVEYRLSDPSATYSLSQRPCKDYTP